MPYNDHNRVLWPSAYNASNKCPALEKGPAILTCLDFYAHIYTAESFEILDTPIYIQVYVHGYLV